LQDVRVRDAVLGYARRLGDGAQRHGGRGREGVETAFETRSDPGKDQTRLPGETLGAAVDEGDDGLGQGIAVVVELDEVVDHPVQPSVGSGEEEE